jgi:hypothetical protein
MAAQVKLPMLALCRIQGRERIDMIEAIENRYLDQELTWEQANREVLFLKGRMFRLWLKAK